MSEKRKAVCDRELVTFVYAEEASLHPTYLSRGQRWVNFREGTLARTYATVQDETDEVIECDIPWALILDHSGPKGWPKSLKGN